ncbi:hypothetical protein [Streptomyces odonnellii]|uniref:hypothetical protein n=1 Tax=Streptomyces odonnellii TaxID=1417980 RepID=UPI000626E92F|nr:hypothetical protein [Streptomyces odonnellii]
MTSTAAAGASTPAAGPNVCGGTRDAPSRPAAQRVVGVLFVDLDGLRARYQCLRPGCPHRREGPAASTDLDENGERIGVGGVKAFIDGIKTQHLSQHHGENR